MSSWFSSTPKKAKKSERPTSENAQRCSARRPSKADYTLKQNGEIRILIIGKTGNGKSTVGNILLGSELFPSGRGLTSTTLEASVKTSVAPNRMHLQVLDTPDISNMGWSQSDKEIEVSEWKKKFHPDAILLAVKCDVRYTPEELSIYEEIKQLWNDDNSFLNCLIIAFTFGDRLDNTIQHEIRVVNEKNQQLKKVLDDARGRFNVFNSKDHQRLNHQREGVFGTIQSLGIGSTPRQYTRGGQKQNAASCSQYGTKRTLRVLIIGKSGTGKSTVGNILLGEDKFPVSRGMYTSTDVAANKKAPISAETELEVIDTPDITNLDLAMDAQADKVSVWKTLTNESPDAVLLTVPCDVRYTPDDLKIYRKIEMLWGGTGSLKPNLIIAFTFGDRLDNSIEDEIKVVYQNNKELKEVLDDARGRYFVFQKSDSHGRKRQRNDFIKQLQAKA